MHIQSPKHVMDELSIYDGKYKREAIDIALAKQKEMTPLLLDLLEDVVKRPEFYIDKNENRMDHTYSLMLLFHFREQQAHEIIAKLFRLPRDMPFRLFGDLITEELQYILAATCGGRTDLIKEMALDESIGEISCREAAWEALSLSVLEYPSKREEIFDLFGGQLEHYRTGGINHPPLSETDNTLAITIIACCCKLYFKELESLILELYEKNIVQNSYFFEKGHVIEFFSKPQNSVLARSTRNLHEKLNKPFHSRMAWWACFNERNPVLDDFYINDKTIPFKLPKNK